MDPRMWWREGLDAVISNFKLLMYKPVTSSPVAEKKNMDFNLNLTRNFLVYLRRRRSTVLCPEKGLIASLTSVAGDLNQVSVKFSFVSLWLPAYFEAQFRKPNVTVYGNTGVHQ